MRPARGEGAIRRHLEPGQKAAIAIGFLRGSEGWHAAHAVATHEAKSEGAKRREATKRGTAVSRDTAVVGDGRERTKLAVVAGCSTATAARALALQQKAPAQFERVARGEVPLSKALGEVKLADKRALAEEIRANPVVTPDGRYQVIAIDPPWRYDSRVEDTTHRGRNPYPDMTTDEVCALPVAKLAQDDCVLWLWTTNAFMPDAYRCLDAWGFAHKTILTWDKVNLGLGDWLRNVTEHCILAVRGRPIVSLTNQTTLISEKRREHSAKPEAFYSLVDALCPGSKLEMFSRTNRHGWTAWGINQAEGAA